MGQTGQSDISGKAKTSRSLRTLQPTSDAARMAHNATHESGVQSVLRIVDEVLRTDESKIQSCITFVETRSGVEISFMCVTKEILRHLKLMAQSSDHSM